MISYNLSSMNKAKKLVNVCDRYKAKFNVDIIYGRQIIDGCSILGVASLVGHIVSIETSSDKSEEDYLNFVKEVEEADTCY